MQIVENTVDLENICKKISNDEFVCVDLEFLREYTYFAKLCLIQIASKSIEAIIDPLAKEIDLQAFWELMQNNNVVKVFHSCRQDVEIIYHMSGKVPVPLFDTQVMAQAAGYGDAISYENLVMGLLKVKLDKSSRLSDWSKRPLSEEQLNYGIGDVTYMVKLYQKLKKWLEENNRSHWIDEELAVLRDENTYKTEPFKVWEKMKHCSHSPLFLTILRELGAWREKRAIMKNVPRQSFIKDDVLFNICSVKPLTKEDLANVRGMRKDIVNGKIGDEIIEIIKKVKDIKKSDYVVPPKRKSFQDNSKPLQELIKMLQKIVAQENKITPHMLASEEDIRNFCENSETKANFLSGWRYEIFGIRAEKLAQGKSAIVYNAEKQQIEFKEI